MGIDEAHRTEERGTKAGGAEPGHSEAAHSAVTQSGASASPVASADATGDVRATGRARWEIEFDVLRNAQLHTMRQRWFDSLHRWLMFLIVISGTAGIAAPAANLMGPVAFSAATALLATLDLVLDLRTKGRLHDDLRRRYYLLLAEIKAVPNSDAVQAAAWEAQIFRLTAEEPDLYRAVDCMAYNATMRTLGRDPRNMLVIPWWRRLFAHLHTCPNFDPETRREMTARRARRKSAQG